MHRRFTRSRCQILKRNYLASTAWCLYKLRMARLLTRSNVYLNLFTDEEDQQQSLVLHSICFRLGVTSPVQVVINDRLLSIWTFLCYRNQEGVAIRATSRSVAREHYGATQA